MEQVERPPRASLGKSDIEQEMRTPKRLASSRHGRCAEVPDLSSQC
jgi:hypothetical protein